MIQLLGIAGVIAAPLTSGAQQWRIGLEAGRIRSNLDPIDGNSEMLGVVAGYENAFTALRLSASVPTANDSVRWGAIGVWKRFARTNGGITAGLDLSGNAFVFSMRSTTSTPVGGGLFEPPGSRIASTTATGRAIAAQALPVVAYTAGALELQGRAGVSYHDATLRDDAERNRVVPLADVQLVYRVAPTLALIPMIRHAAPRGESALTFAGASAVAVTSDGGARAWSSAGRWIAGLGSTASGATAWSVGGELRVTPLAVLTASLRQDGFDPLHLTTPQRSWSVGASLTLGGRAGARATPVATRDANGAATIRLPVSRAAAPPRVAGDFNDWTPAPMQRDGSQWTYVVAARPGVYNYAFVAADGVWFVPEGVPGRKSDGMGGHVATVVIR